ncbi:anti-anti-sigma factor [Virgisporangium aliadipatigenens]|uniref:Anti-anti-sigma factor n=1 Tax=Virgisporangium aliadipatigenens TaxID=741659 RepID=A0A8J3YLV4_9ACTN|nr:STAS domain-containing protein [Virgisporangium aliadipatigenens]GIJ47854.1 anti-anti-sigma factor [Virgisporangium aliadipatigenens]
MTPPLTLTSSRRPDGVAVLAAAGEIDLSNARTFASALAGAVSDDGPLLVDLTGVEYLDSAGLAALLPHVARIRIVVGELLAPVITIAGLTDITTVDGR